METADSLPEDSYKPSKSVPNEMGKNTAAFVNEMAAVAPTKKTKVVKKVVRSMARKVMKKQPLKKLVKPKKVSKSKKMNTFRILSKNQ